MEYENVGCFSKYRKILVLAAIAAVLPLTEVEAVIIGKFGFPNERFVVNYTELH